MIGPAWILPRAINCTNRKVRPMAKSDRKAKTVRKRPVSARGIPTFAQLVRESIAAGMARREAEAHARTILASYDLIIVDPRTGRWRFDTGGKSIFDAARSLRTQTKGKTRKPKGAE